jgi:outer membrane protein
MKKIVLLVVICYAFTFLLASCNQNSKSASGGDAGSIVYVNGDTLLVKYTYAVDQNKELKSFTDSLQGAFQQRETSFQNNYTTYQKQSSSMSEAQRKQAEDVLGQQQQELQQMQQIFQQQMSKKQLDLTTQLSKKVQDFLKDYSAQHHYKLILLYNQLISGTGLLYGDPSIDITNDLIKDLNAAYAKDKK